MDNEISVFLAVVIAIGMTINTALNYIDFKGNSPKNIVDIIVESRFGGFWFFFGFFFWLFYRDIIYIYYLLHYFRSYFTLYCFHNGKER